ncbi:MAG: hypothetical protein DWQ06_01820 [Calditrichaeota bacterium]|nr:MAG: hypothetical protein DWQ06_01820 [Calditrichota bacterium]
MVKRTLITSVAIVSLLAAGSMAAESNPSNVTGFVRYDLSISGSNGLNIVALPFSQAENASPISDILDVETQIGGNYAQGLYLDNASKSYSNHIAGDPTGFGLTHGDNFIIIVGANDQFVAAGGVGESTSPVSFSLSISGSNGLNAVSNVPYSDLAGGSNIASILDVETQIGANYAQGLYHDNASKAYSNHIAGDPTGFAIDLGTPFYIIVSGNDTFSGPTSGNGSGNIFSAEKVSSPINTNVAKKAPAVKKSATTKKSVKAQSRNLKRTRSN